MGSKLVIALLRNLKCSRLTAASFCIEGKGQRRVRDNRLDRAYSFNYVNEENCDGVQICRVAQATRTLLWRREVTCSTFGYDVPMMTTNGSEIS